MNIFVLDKPLLILGFLLLAWARVFRGRQYFLLLCQFVATFSAQYSFGISLSLARLVPIFSAVGIYRAKSVGLKIYIPFLFYVLISSLSGSFFWEIPSSVNFWYGNGRIILQLFNFLVLAASCAALASALAEQGGVKMLMIFLQLAAIVHGLASVYQLIASSFGLPLIGISRAHGLTFEGGTGDVAVFISDNGAEIFRPGGLMGEPKSAAVLFGIIVLHGIFIRNLCQVTRKENIFNNISLILSSIGFLVAFSTSAFIGFAFVLFAGIVVFVPRVERPKILIRIIAIIVVMFFGWFIFHQGDFDAFWKVIFQRTSGRFENDMDPPVQASINEILGNPWVAIFGVGLGGSSFVIMKFIGAAFNYAYAPNIGFILLLVETGLIGTLLFLGVFFMQVVRIGLSSFSRRDYETRTLLIVGVSAMSLCLVGSGIPLGIPLAVACIAVAAKKVRLEKNMQVSFIKEK